MKKIIVIGPGKMTRGGITSVIKAHSNTNVWEKWNCIWIESYIDKNLALKLFYFFWAIFKFLFNLRRTLIVHIHLSEPISAKRKNIFLQISKLAGKSTILHLHAHTPETSIFGKEQNLYKQMFDKADSVIVLSGFWHEQVCKIVENTEKIKIIYNPCPIVEKQEVIKKKNQILFAGTLKSRKGYKDLIKAFSKLAPKYPDWKIVFAGNGEIEEAKELTKELKISSQVEFLGWISGEEKNKLFSSSEIFCLPSYAEGFPMAVLDAWAFGLPVITTPVGGLPDVLKYDENALVFNPGDIKRLSENIERLIIDRHLRKKLSDESISLSSNTFSLYKTGKELELLYLSLT